MNVRKVDTNQ